MKRNTLGIVALVVLVGLVASVSLGQPQTGAPKRKNAPIVYHTVKRGDMSMSLVSRGMIESQENIRIVSELGAGNKPVGATLRWIIGNGTEVKEGDLVAEFDSAGHRETVDVAILELEQARADLIGAEAKLRSVRVQSKTDEEEAALQARLAELEHKMLVDPADGILALEGKALDREIANAESRHAVTQLALEISKKAFEAKSKLFKGGQIDKLELDRAKLALLVAEHEYQEAVNLVRASKAEQKLFRTSKRELRILEADGKVALAKRTLVRAKNEGQARLAQVEVGFETTKHAMKKAEVRLQRAKDQLAKCKVYAPRSGLIVHAPSVPLRAGSLVRRGQHLVSIPNLAKFQARTSVSEAVVDRYRVGAKVVVRADAYPDRSWSGAVKSVSVLPRRGGRGGRVYDVTAALTDPEGLKPGLTGNVELSAPPRKGVLAVPVECVEWAGREPRCYVSTDKGIERRVVKVGANNGRFVEVVSGIDEGDRVVVNPARLDSKR